MPNAMNRRIVLKSAAAAGSLLAMPYVGRAQGKTLRLFAWEGYAEDAWVKDFEAQNGAKLNITYAGSVDEMFAKMAASKGADYDIVYVDTSSIPRYQQGGLIKPIDTSKIANVGNLEPAFQALKETRDGDKIVGIPFAWGSLGIIYDVAHFGDKPPSSWATMWDPALEGRMIALDDANNNVVTAALKLGLPDPFNLTDEQFEQVKQALIEQKKLLVSYYAGFDEGVQIWKKNNIVAMFSMGEFQLASMLKQNMNVKYIIPSEGAIGWIDCALISAGAQNEELAYAWINYQLQKKIGAEMTEKLFYGNTTNKIEGMDYAAQLKWLQPPENFDKRIKVWNEVKAAI
jgi:putative spermidine/putrescine transport system substrate-binding protein/spermidine/putrescine transport system substrate-binding protein